MWETNHPTEDCEAFILVQNLEESDGFQKDDIVMSTDWYNAEQGTWFGLKGHHKLLMWNRITFPCVPKKYARRVQGPSTHFPQKASNHQNQ